MKRMKFLVFASLALLLWGTDTVAQTERKITVKVMNIPSKVGKILLATDKGQQSMADATDKQVEIELKNVPNGKYKLYVFHDANNNWQLDKANGIPVEYCAEMDIEITDETKCITVRLVDVKKEMEESNRKKESK